MCGELSLEDGIDMSLRLRHDVDDDDDDDEILKSVSAMESLCVTPRHIWE